MNYDYLRDPAAIEAESFRRIRLTTDVRHLDEHEQQVALRVVHSCGEPQVVDKLRFSHNAIATGLAQLQGSATVLCDVQMVKHGLTRRLWSGDAHCFINEEIVAALAQARSESRSMAALELWLPHLAGSMVLIGNAPTALFRLLEMLAAGAPKPALIVGMPVGFVGAAESKEALWLQHQQLGVPCITLLGNAGGSAMTAAVFNALARLARGIRC